MPPLIWLDPLARAQIECEARRRRIVETGGPLFGYESDEDVVIAGAGGPGPKARHRPRSFQPDRDAVDRAIDHVRQASDRRFRYLGSWHTHPLGRARPSATDVGAARGITEEPEVLLPRPLVLIQSTWPTRRTLRDRDLRVFRWIPELATLGMIELRVMRENERHHPVLALDWDTIVS